MVPLRIIKVGGSLFDLEDLSARLTRWLALQSPAANVFIAGGGPLADAVRAWDRRFQMGDEAAHWMCIDLLDTTASLLGHLLPQAQRISDWNLLGERQLQVFAPALFLRDHEPNLPGLKLPQSWDVTADSIAARLAEVTGTAELVVLKSTLAATGSLIDPHFAAATKSVSQVRLVNLRDDRFPSKIN